MGEFKTGRICIRSLFGENKFKAVFSIELKFCIVFLVMNVKSKRVSSVSVDE